MDKQTHSAIKQIRDLLGKVEKILERLEGKQTLPAPEILAKVEAHLEEGRCLLCREIKPDSDYVRGCCRSCYNKLMHQAKKPSGTSIETLILEGKLAPEDMVEKGPKSDIGKLLKDPTLESVKSKAKAHRPSPKSKKK